MSASRQRVHADGRVELEAPSTITHSPLYSDDLAPTRIEQRTWTTYNYAALWISMAHCIPTYKLASGLIDVGMSWAQALFTILLGNCIVLAPILLNSHPGTKYGIPFPVFARAAYGVRGSNLPALMRALVACGWFGINCWIGGGALQTFVVAMVPGWNGALGTIGGYPGTLWLAFAVFWAINILVVYRGMDLLRKIENWAAPFVLVMTAILVVWAVKEARGLGELMSKPGKFPDFASFYPIFIPSLTGMIGFWATLSLNMPDFTRFGKSQRGQMVGQVVALPTTMTVFAAMGVVITSATAIIFHKVIWDPVKLVGEFQDRWVVAISMVTIVIATLSVNIAANVVSPANDFANAFPKKITFARGGLLTGIIGILMMPWKLADDPTGYIYSWLVGYSGGLGSIAGVLIVDYWIIRRRELDIADLYLEDGRYRYDNGWNRAAVMATVVGCVLAWGGLLVPDLRRVFDYAWFVGGLGAGGCYYVAMKLQRTGPASPHYSRRPDREESELADADGIDGHDRAPSLGATPTGAEAEDNANEQ